jgi:hypothetical protein
MEIASPRGAGLEMTVQVKYIANEIKTKNEKSKRETLNEKRPGK